MFILAFARLCFPKMNLNYKKMKNDIATNIRQSHFFSRRENQALTDYNQIEGDDEHGDENEDEFDDENEEENDMDKSREMPVDPQLNEYSTDETSDEEE